MFLVPMESVCCMCVCVILAELSTMKCYILRSLSIRDHANSIRTKTQWSGEGESTICNFQMVICLCQHLYAIRDTLIVVIVRVSTLYYGIYIYTCALCLCICASVHQTKKSIVLTSLCLPSRHIIIFHS